MVIKYGLVLIKVNFDYNSSIFLKANFSFESIQNVFVFKTGYFGEFPWTYVNGLSLFIDFTIWSNLKKKKKQTLIHVNKKQTLDGFF